MSAVRRLQVPRLRASSKLAATRFNIQNRCYAAAQANDIEGMLQQKTFWETYPDSIRKLAVFAEHARAHNYQIPLLSKAQQGSFSQEKAYHVAAAIRQLREMNGEVAIGRKLGFTNQALWPEYGVNESNWSYIYHDTVADLPEHGDVTQGKVIMANISHLSALEPKIEPEIMFGLKRPVHAGMTDLELLDSIDWVAHGFEIVVSVFPHWKFTAADATAAFSLHGLLLVGPRMRIQHHEHLAQSLLKNLRDFDLELHKNGEVVARGSGGDVLGSPINALRALADMLAKDPHNKPLEAGEVITTGTITKPFAIKDGDEWSTKIRGIRLPDLDVRFKLS